MAIFNETTSGGSILGGKAITGLASFGGPLIGGVATVTSIYFKSTSGGVLVHPTFSRHFTLDGSGGVSVYRCACVTKTTFFITTYGPGDIAFSAFAAKKGILEKVCIKAVYLNCIPRNCAVAGAGCFPLYKDKYNSVWFDENLLSQAAATTIAQTYIDIFKGHEEQLLRNC